jgi:serine/threonine protein kinase
MTNPWNKYDQLCSERLHHALSHEFPQILLQKNPNHKQYLESYLQILSSSINLSLMKEILGLIQKNASEKELRDLMKVFQLPLGLRNLLVQFIYQIVVGKEEGQLLLEQIYVVEQISSNQLKVCHPDWGCLLLAEVSSSFAKDDQSLQIIRSRCNQWISLGSHGNIVPGYFCRLNSLKQELVFFYEVIEPRLSLHSYLQSKSCDDLSDENLGSIKDDGDLHQAFHLMISLCHGLEVCHNKGLAHLNLNPESILISPIDALVEGTDEMTFQAVLSSLCLSDLDTQAENLYTAPESSRSSFSETPSSQLFPMDIFSVGMVFLDIIRGRSLCSIEGSVKHRLYSPSVNWDQTAKIELIDWAFSESHLPRRRIYALMPLIELCLSENPHNRPTIRSLLEKIIEINKFCPSNKSLPLPSPSLPLDSPSNLSNLAISDFESGLLESARNRWISSLTNHQSNLDIVWNINLFRWRIGEISPSDFIEILCQHQCQYHPNDSPEVELAQRLIRDVLAESLFPCKQSFKFKSSLFTPLKCFNLTKTYATITDPFSLKIECPLGNHQFFFDLGQQKFEENFVPRSHSSFPSPFGLTSATLCLDPQSDYITLLDSPEDDQICLSIGEILNFDSTIFFVERPVGCDFVLNQHLPDNTPQLSVVYLLLEGRWATANDLESTSDCLEDDPSSSSGYQIESAGSQSTPSEQYDHHITPAPPKRHYLLVIGTLDASAQSHSIPQRSFEVYSFTDLLGISSDQRPYGLKLFSPNTLCVCGSGGLLAIVTPPLSTRKHLSVRVVHINTDQYLLTASSTSESKGPVVTKAFHSVEATITDISYSCRTHSLVSGDSLGNLCVWKRSSSLDSPFKILGFPLQVGNRIYKVVHSLENLSTIVSTDSKLLLVRVHLDSLTPTVYIQSILDSSQTTSSDLIFPPRYLAQYAGEFIHVWKLTTTNKLSEVDHFEDAVRAKDDQVYDSMVDEEGITNNENMTDGTHEKLNQFMSLNIEFMIFPNPTTVAKRSDRCKFRSVNLLHYFLKYFLISFSL